MNIDNPASRVYRGPTLALGGTTRELLGERLDLATLLLWCSCFCTLAILYMLLNWLPTLLIERGLNRLDTSAIQVLFNIGGVIGSLLARRLMDKGRALRAVLLAYLGMFAALAVLGNVVQLQGLYLAGWQQEPGSWVARQLLAAGAGGKQALASRLATGGGGGGQRRSIA